MVACGVLVSVASWAGDLYRWVDDQGKAQLSQTVPEKYRQSAVRVDPLPYGHPPAKEGDDCAQLRRLYEESLACFAPYVLANGATKAEAFQKCTVRADPAPLCGIAPQR
jgi:hypothetical protein